MKQHANNDTKKLSQINQTMFDLNVSFLNEFKLFKYDEYLLDFKTKIKDLDKKQKNTILNYYKKTLNDFTIIQQNLAISLSKTQLRIKLIDQKFVEYLNTVSQLLKIYTKNTRLLYKDLITKIPNDNEITTNIKLCDKNLVKYYNDTKDIFANIKCIHCKDSTSEMSKSTDNIHNHSKGNSFIVSKSEISRKKSLDSSNIQRQRNIGSHKLLKQSTTCLHNNIYEHFKRRSQKDNSLDGCSIAKSHDSGSYYQGTSTTDYNSNITQSDLDNSRKHNILSSVQSTPLIKNNKNILLINNNIDISNITILTLSELFEDFLSYMKLLQDTISLNKKAKDSESRAIINDLKKNFERKKMHLINITNTIISSYENNTPKTEQDKDKNKEEILKQEKELKLLKEEFMQKQKKFNDDVIQFSKEVNTLKEQNESLIAQNGEMKSHIKSLEQDNKQITLELERNKKINENDKKKKFMIQKLDENAINIVNQIVIKEKSSNETSGNALINQHNINDLTFSEIINSTLQNNITNGTLDIKTDEEAEINVISGTGNAAINLLEDSGNEETI